MNLRTRKRPMLASLLALAATVGLTLASSSSAAPRAVTQAATQATDDSRIFFVCGGNNLQICTMNGDGSNRSQVADPSQSGLFLNGYYGGFAVSPDGSKIAFSASDSHNNYAVNIYVMNDDGSNIQRVTNCVPGSPCTAPDWSSDGSKIAFDCQYCTGFSVQVFTIDATPGSTPTQLTNEPGGAASPKWSPDGTEILYTIEGGTLITMRLSDGHKVTVPTPLNSFGFAWSPDGTKIAGVLQGLFVMDADGSNVTQIFSGFANTPTWSPDGSQIAFETTGASGFSGSIGIVNADGTGSVRTFGDFATDRQPVWAPGASPIIFIHGMMGSRINCGSDELWPYIPQQRVDSRLPLMRLGSDGLSTLPGACDAQVGDIVDTVAGNDIYKSTVDFLKGIAPGRNYVFTWDWRKSPELSLARLDALVDQVRAQHGGAKVVLMAHSMGGLLARWYVDDPGRAAKLARVLTIGTPYWGAPKSLFPLAAGIATPQSEPMDAFLNDKDLQELARNLFGLYFLYPSDNYGPWLTLAPPGPGTLDRAGLLAYVGNDLHGNAALLERALDTHANMLDGFKTNGVDYRVVVGTGLNTISRVTILDKEVGVKYATGDATVPAVSAVQGTPGTANPLGEDVPISYACGVEHGELPNNADVEAAIKGFLLSGADIQGQGVRTAPCPASGFQIQIFPLQVGPLALRRLSLARAAAGSAVSLEDAQLQDLAQVLEFPNQTIVVTDTSRPVELALPTGTYRLEVTPLQDGAEGQTLVYGPLTGQVTFAASDTLAVFQDGQQVEPGAVDSVAPATEASASPAANANGWNNTDVTVSFSARDEGGSGVKEIVYSLGGAQTVVAGSSASVAITAEGVTTLTYFARDNAGNTEAQHTLTLSIDKTPPTISCPTPAPTFTLQQAGAAVEATAADALSGPVTGNLRAGADTTSVGAKSVTFSTEDQAGNAASKTCSYRVAYGFDGFFRPVDNAGVLNVVKAGQAVPLKWRLTNAAGNPVTNLAVAQVTVQSLSCSLGTTEDLVEELAAGASGLQNLGNGNYQLNWKTPTSYAGSCKTLRLDLGEGSFRTALFKFTK